MTKKHYIKINGYSNKFYGWGGEDDSLYERLTIKGLRLHRPKMDIGRFKMNQIDHFRSDPWNAANRYLLGRYRHRPSLDGLTTIKRLRYSVNVTSLPLFTLISIDLFT